MNATKTTYAIELVQGYSGVDHFGAEIVAYADGPHESLQKARRAIKAARKLVGHPRAYEPRIDIVSSAGRRYTWS